MSEEVDLAPVRRAYALVGEVISTSTEIEIELLYISLLLAENASSVNQLWHRVSGFRQRIDLTDVVVELTNAHTKTRQFWIAFRRALLELNSLRNHIAHGALLNDGEGDEEVEQIHIMKIYEDNSAKLVSLDDMERLKDLMREALEEARWFNKFLVDYGSNFLLEEATKRVASIRKRASSLKDNQAKNMPGKELTAKLRKPPVQKLTPLEAAKNGAGRRSARLRRQVVDLGGEQAPLPLEGGSGASLSTPDSEALEEAPPPVQGNASA